MSHHKTTSSDRLVTATVLLMTLESKVAHRQRKACGSRELQATSDVPPPAVTTRPPSVIVSPPAVTVSALPTAAPESKVAAPPTESVPPSFDVHRRRPRGHTRPVMVPPPAVTTKPPAVIVSPPADHRQRVASIDARVEVLHRQPRACLRASMHRRRPRGHHR